METDVDAFLRRLAQELRPRVNRSAEALVERMRDELSELSEYEDLAARTLEESAGHVTVLLDMLEHRLDPTTVATPPLALELAREAARRGIALSVLLRAFRLGHMAVLDLMREEAARLTSDWRLIDQATMHMLATTFAHVDRSSEQVVALYQHERDRQVQRRLILANKASALIGSTLDIARTAEELAEVGTEDFADFVTVDLLDAVLHDGQTPEPSAAEPVLRRIAQIPEGFGDPYGGPPVATGGAHTYPADSDPAGVLRTGEPVLREVSAPGAPRVRSVLLLSLQARGSTLGVVKFVRERTADPFVDDDLRLAQEISARAAVSIDNARQYTYERLTALTLQRSLLPLHTAQQPAVEMASRYLPSSARAGVGGDWYDVIPLSGARVALVVGDVVGRGLHASATMGRLRTAVRAFADIDLMPDELLTHLDDVVIRLQREEQRDDSELSATCLYAIYDPISRTCALASAGHVLPAIGTPLHAREVEPVPSKGNEAPAVRSVYYPEMPIGPPLGLGGLPFETAQFELPEDSLLALYTDGLVQSRSHDVDVARATLRDVLAHAPHSPERICDRVLAALLPHRPTDDVALLVARTKSLAPEHVATLDLPADPAAVAGARTLTTDRLAQWGLDELSFATELIVSELVTNAIRYGKPPIQLRLILQSTLTCEVSDASSTAPHLRRARTFDEGGRGLLLVAQLAARWGARHHREGKVIWAEQPLPAQGLSPLPG
ncbi:SpoIIE family protein phosphatase [Streptomyces sp. NA04227]|uniref:SpoIIE family protein phosphatase n=1 Tax=Streptomyces sp. NA04227 TaxID=2742136 RepID=UPI00158FB642|nr:SpoIIE family protein phosphatase [Streptomyces sp. NA04227]QKW09578.1 SpoIIE family protein phosphatase [Streptomyces sp. NA04227]